MKAYMKVKESDEMKKQVKPLVCTLSLLIAAGTAFTAPKILAQNEESTGNLAEQPNAKQSVSDQTGMFMSTDKNGNVEYIEVKPKGLEKELELPEEKDEDTKFEVKLQFGDNEPQTIASYDTFEEANAAMVRRSMFRSPGDVSVYTDNQVRSVTTGVVNFNTKKTCGINTSYKEDGTNASGYTNGCYGADGAFLGTSADGTLVKFKMSGVTGWVKKSEVQILNYSSVKSVSHYRVEEGRLYHYITTDVSVNDYAAVTDIGPAQSYMSEGAIYYSYDGHYFYKNYASMIADYKKNRTSSSINPNNPYYNYFQYLSHRTKTTFTAAEINQRVVNAVGSKKSALKNTGEAFINAQNAYGANAALVFGLAVNESGWGQSDYALNRNNIFGHNAIDSDPDRATYYASVAESINHHAKRFVSETYMDPKDAFGTYHGSHLGDKESGMNVSYASDPYWGEKAAAQGYYLESQTGNKKRDFGKYTIGIKEKGTSLTVRKEASSSSTALYTTGNWGSYPFVIIGTVKGESINGNTTWYKIQSDSTLNSNRTSIVQDKGEYDFSRDYGYVSAAYVKVVQQGYDSTTDPGNSNNNKPTPEPTPTPTPTPTYKKGDVNNDGKISASDYGLVKNHILKKSKLTGDKLKAADVNGDGKISASDYGLIKNHILGKYVIK